MNILKISLRDPNIHKNGVSKLVIERSKALRAQGHNVDMVSFGINPNVFWKCKKEVEDKEAGIRRIRLELGLTAVVAYLIRALVRIIRSWPPLQCIESHIYWQAFRHDLIKIASERHVCHTYHIRCMGLWDLSKYSRKFVVDLIDSYTLNYRNRLRIEKSWLYKLIIGYELSRIEACESSIEDFISEWSNVTVLVVTERDASYIKTSKIRKGVVPVGIDIIGSENKQIAAGAGEEYRVIFFGNLNYEPNKMACELLEVISSLSYYGHVRFTVAGRNASMRLVRRMESIGINVVSPVGCMESLVRIHDAVILPMVSGSGMQSKLLEAIAWEKIVIATARVAEPLGLIDNIDYLKAESADEFGRRINELLEGCIDTNTIIMNARQKIKRLQWADTVSVLVCYYEDSLLLG